MYLPIRLQVTSSETCLGDAITLAVNESPMTLISMEVDGVVVGIDSDTTPGMALDMLAESLPGCHIKFYSGKPVAIQASEIHLDPTIEAVDVVNLKPEADHVWNAIFKKPPPVFDRQHWAESDVSDKFIYIPNCTSFEGASTEDYNSNSMYTQIMLEAYQEVCGGRNVNPLVHLPSGLEVPVMSLSPFHASQTHIDGERASGFANSTLVDFDDGEFAKDFLTAVSLLRPDQFTTEPARQTVLAKAELILAGKASHIYNQRFMRDYFSLLTVNYAEDMEEVFKSNSAQAQTTILSIFRAMVSDGEVLESGLDEFKSRVWQNGMGQYEDFICKIYKETIDD